VAECAEGGRLMANGGRRSPRGRWRRCTEAPTAVGGEGVKGDSVQRQAESGDRRARFATSALRGRNVRPPMVCTWAEQLKNAKRRSLRPPNVLGVSCTAGSACRSRSGAAVAANDVRSTEWRTATAVTPSSWRRSRQLGCRTEAGPCQLHTKLGSVSTTRLLREHSPRMIS
jgi:hypothetical protein